VALDAHHPTRAASESSAHLLARDTDLFCNLCAADDDRGVLGQEGQQPVNAPVGGSGRLANRFVAIRSEEGYSTGGAATS